MTEACEDCGAAEPSMFNCNKKGERKPGFLCIPCWMAKRPEYQEPRKRVHPVIWTWLAFAVAGFAGFAGFAIYYG